MPVVGALVRAAGADVVEQHDPVVVLERGRDQAPHLLIAAEAMREEHRLRRLRAGNPHVVARRDVQAASIDTRSGAGAARTKTWITMSGSNTTSL